MNQIHEILYLLKSLISIPSISKEEESLADFLYDYFIKNGLCPVRKENNIWIKNRYYSPDLPTILLNSHIDTVKPVFGWTLDPFKPIIERNKLYGLGSNDAGVSLVSLFLVFLQLNNKSNLGFNLIFSATAEEEISGNNGIISILPELGHINLGIIGEPTNFKMAVAEKGLMVLDCYSWGKAGHAAYLSQDNAIIKCLEDLQWLDKHKFKHSSALLGDTITTVTQINGGKQHNVIPDTCHFVVDVRINEYYSNQEVLNIINTSLKSEVRERSLKLNSSSIAMNHPVVKRAKELGLDLFGSHTLSDQSLLNFNTVKIGPGCSERSHTANEFIYIDEIDKGVETYLRLLNNLKL